MVRWILASWFVFVGAGALRAQRPEPLDLAAIGQRLGGGDLPPVLGVIPAADLQELVQQGDLLADGDVVPVLRHGSSSARLAAAVRVLRQPVSARATAAGCFHEIVACAFVVSLARTMAISEQVFGRVPPAWLLPAADAARVRGRGLARELLRAHGEDPLVATWLLSEDPTTLGVSPAQVLAEARRRLAAAGSAEDLVSCASAALRERDPDAAATLLERAAAAPSPASLAGRRALAMRVFNLRERLAGVRALIGAAQGDDLPARIANVRLLQLVDAEAAFAECRRLAEAGVAHSLPYSLLAAKLAMVSGEEAAGPMLVQAVQAPGGDDQTAGALLMCRVLPLIRRAAASPAAADTVRADLDAVLGKVDAIVAGLDSEPATVLRWLRTQWSFPSDATIAAMPGSLAAARALWRTLPRSRAAAIVTLVAAGAASDDLALEVLTAPLPEAVSDLHDIALLRASLFVRWHLARDREPTAAVLDAVLGELERAQRDPRDGHYLRGALAWSRAAKTRHAADLEAARDLFAKAQRGPAEPGWWRAASALAVANGSLGAAIDLEGLIERRVFRDGSERHVGLSLLCMISASADAPPEALDAVQRVVTATAVDRELAVLHGATAVGRLARGDEPGARKSAALALQAIERMAAADPPAERGVVCVNAFHWSYGLTGARLVLDLNAHCEPWIVPILPDRDRLRAIAEAK